MPETSAKTISEVLDHTGAWDWENKHVSQSYLQAGATEVKDIAINDIVESGTVLIAAGPSDLGCAVKMSNTTPVARGTSSGIRIVPIGLVETAQISMNKPLSRIFEIGSMLSYIIPGRAIGGISLSRVFFDGPSLLKAIYAGEVMADYADDKRKYVKFASKAAKDGGYQSVAHIGSGNLAMNLASRFFNAPVGLSFFFRDQESDNVAQIYFEGCQVGTWNMGISANMNVLTEAISMEFVRCFPIVTHATYTTPAAKPSLMDLNIVSAPSNQAA